jgi:hypothetical protein
MAAESLCAVFDDLLEIVDVHGADGLVFSF